MPSPFFGRSRISWMICPIWKILAYVDLTYLKNACCLQTLMGLKSQRIHAGQEGKWCRSAGYISRCAIRAFGAHRKRSNLNTSPIRYQPETDGTAKAYARTEPVTGTFLTADVYEVTGEEFALEADVGDVLEEHGPGVYTVQVWATLGGEPTVISTVSVFHEVDVPEGYGPGLNLAGMGAPSGGSLTVL